MILLIRTGGENLALG